MPLGLRTIKITLAAVVAIYIAQFIGLENSLATGIITILTLLDTRKASREISLTYLLATVLAFGIAAVIFLVFGYQVWAFGLYLLIFVALAYRLKLSAAIAPVSVLVTHFVIAESVVWQWQLNGLLIMVIGAGVAILFNLWMPNQKPELQKAVGDIEDNFRIVLELISQRLLENDFDIPLIRTEVDIVNESIEKMRKIAVDDYENQLFNKDDYYIRYADMRLKQLGVLSRMVDSLQHVSLKTEQNKTLGNMFKLTSDEFDQSNSGHSLLKSINELYTFYRSSDLPRDREEFESRAILYHILIEFERFLEIKREFYLDKHIRKF
ncbi:aromatic acid exporter family protein [Aerococcaceae bacterium DSM 111021]|nr:aromatic acid exporter family protein [Aerococcaceae bacterium DSM 111021]